MEYKFKKAKAVWKNNVAHQWNQMMGFKTKISLEEPKKVTIAIAARSYYRLYINGKMKAHGPARCAHKHLRVDELKIELGKESVIALEIAHYDKPGHYSNTITMEPGLVIAEVICDGKVISATGSDIGEPWYCKEMEYRHEYVELMSHSREIMEVYDFDKDTMTWVSEWDEKSLHENWECPELIKAELPTYLVRYAPYPNYEKLPAAAPMKVGDVQSFEPQEPMLDIMSLVQPVWNGMIQERILQKAVMEKERLFSGRLLKKTSEYNLHLVVPDKQTCFAAWDLGQVITGFIYLDVTVEKSCIVDILSADRLDDTGCQSGSMIVRYHLKPGTYHLVSYEPYFYRWLKVVFRDSGDTVVHQLGAMTYWYPDHREGSFTCSDGDLNAIYEAARRTLQANTLDVFMDCPQRERGGWLCDSFWTARAARMLFGDTGVETDFIENFLLTDSDFYQYSIFPEVYPGNSKQDSGNPGITNWSFWLALELCEYYRRTGNQAFIEKYRTRIERFVEGTLQLMGDGGIIYLPAGFVDWSQANMPYNLLPASLPLNCLYACMLENLGKMYDKSEWTQSAEQLWQTLCQASGGEMFGPPIGTPMSYADALEYKDGRLVSGKLMSEAAMFLEVWSGFSEKNNNPGFRRNVIETMGVCPEKPYNVQVGRADLFIGQMIRLDMLSKYGATDQMIKEMRKIYLDQIKQGPGTLYENMGGYGSRCHGFNGHAGVLLMRDVLGIHEPDACTKTITIAPHVSDLTWAVGKTVCGDAYVSVAWEADAYNKTFAIHIQKPENWNIDLKLPDEISNWKLEVEEQDYK